MRLTRTSDAAFRILVLMARRDSRLSAQLISQELDIPFNQAAKILQHLARAGFVRTAKGKGGGVELAVPPEKISLDKVITAIEGPIYLMECTVNNGACIYSENCLLSKKIKEAQDCMLRIFENSTIAELIKNNNQ